MANRKLRKSTGVQGRRRKAAREMKSARPVGRPTKYDATYSDAVIEHAAQTGRSLLAFAGSLRVSRTTLNDWAKEHPEFREAMEVAKAVRANYIESICDDTTNAVQMNYRLLALKNCGPEDWRDAKETGVDSRQRPGTNPSTPDVTALSAAEAIARLMPADQRADLSLAQKRRSTS